MTELTPPALRCVCFSALSVNLSADRVGLAVAKEEVEGSQSCFLFLSREMCFHQAAETPPCSSLSFAVSCSEEPFVTLVQVPGPAVEARGGRSSSQSLTCRRCEDLRRSHLPHLRRLTCVTLRATGSHLINKHSVCEAGSFVSINQYKHGGLPVYDVNKTPLLIQKHKNTKGLKRSR